MLTPFLIGSCSRFSQIPYRGSTGDPHVSFLLMNPPFVIDLVNFILLGQFADSHGQTTDKTMTFLAGRGIPQERNCSPRLGGAMRVTNIAQLDREIQVFAYWILRASLKGVRRRG